MTAATANGKPGRSKGRAKPTLLDRLLRQAERTLAAMERAKDPASVKDLNGLYRLLDRIRSERESSAELERLKEVAGS